VNSLRRRQQSEIDMLDRAIAGLEGTVAEEQLTQLRALRQEMQDALETSPAPSIAA